MKNSLLFALIGVGLLVTSCSTANKLDQTVDDVYYSPGRPGVEKVDITKSQEKKEIYESYVNNTDEQFLRMKVGNYYRWNMLDDYTYWNDSRYDFGHYNYYNPIGFNYYYSNKNWNYGWGNPYYTLVNYYNPKSSIGKPSESGITAYKNKNYNNNNNTGYSKSSYYNSNIPTPGVSGSSNFSNLVKKVFSSSAAGGSYDRAARSFDNSSSSSSTYSSNSASGSSGSNAAPSSSAGGNSGGVKSSGSSASTPRATRNN
ncbi:MAG: hypothetical protein WCH78_07290 [Bacteroidota bacterium]